MYRNEAFFCSSVLYFSSFASFFSCYSLVRVGFGKSLLALINSGLILLFTASTFSF